MRRRQMMKLSKAFVLWRRRLSYMIFHRDCIHTHHHSEIQGGFEVRPKKAINAEVVSRCTYCTVDIPEEP